MLQINDFFIILNQINNSKINLIKLTLEPHYKNCMNDNIIYLYYSSEYDNDILKVQNTFHYKKHVQKFGLRNPDYIFNKDIITDYIIFDKNGNECFIINNGELKFIDTSKCYIKISFDNITPINEIGLNIVNQFKTINNE